MNLNFQSLSDEEKSKNSDRGLLKVEVPHWATDLKIYKGDSLRQVTDVGKITTSISKNPDGTSANVYKSEVSLPPGIYQVEASLEGKTETLWVPVQPEQATQVPQTTWKNLEFTTSAPLQETNNNDDLHIRAAENWSQKKTSNKSNTGSSALFLFVRTLKPERYGQTFADGLQLFNEGGELLTDFSSGVKKNTAEGWLAFNARLKSGGYILRRGRPGVRRRYQVFYLCDNWQTQIFLDSERYPSLRRLSYNMSRLDKFPHATFRTDDQTALAAEAIFNFLRYDTDSISLFNNDRIDILLDEKTENPWLGILAAYAIERLKQEIKPDNKDKYSEYISILKEKILPFLEREIPAHPDVRALLLKDDEMAKMPFSFPPMLWRSLKKIYQHASRLENTVSPGSLTDCLRDNVVANSPWTAWRQLTQMPTFGWSKTNASYFAVEKPENDESTSPVTAFPSILPKVPIYRLGDMDEPVTAQPTTRQRKKPISDTQSLIYDVSVIQKVEKLIKNFVLSKNLKNLPTEVPLNSSEEINSLLDTFEPETFSQTYGLPLTQTRKNLEQLKMQATTNVGGLETTATDAIVQGTIIQMACYESDQLALSDKKLKTKTPRTRVKDIVSQLFGEAERLALNTGRIKETAEPSTALFKKIIKRINRVALEVLKQADFVLITDLQGRILFCNGVFLLLTTAVDKTITPPSPEENKIKFQQQVSRWSEVLVDVPPGSKKISVPSMPRGFQKWNIWRVQIQADPNENMDSLNLDLLRIKGIQPLKDGNLREISLLTSELANFASLFVYGSKENYDEYLAQLDETTTKLERRIGLPAAHSFPNTIKFMTKRRK